MESIYSRLFRYKSRLDREPLEDFLSEALADLLSRMPPEEVFAFLDYAVDGGRSSSFSQQLQGRTMEWQTQVAVPGGIIDIGLFADGRPVLVIENKTWSAFQDHSTEDVEANQLHTYCNWMASESASSEGCALLLITGTTASPADFKSGGTYAIERREQITWAELGRWLLTRALMGEVAAALWRDLALDLIAFIKEKKLSSEIFVASDISAAHIMLPTMARWDATFESIWQGCHSEWTGFLNPRVSELAFNTEAGMLWHWRYCKPIGTLEKVWVGLGLRFPDQSTWYEGMNLPDDPHFVFIVATDAGELVHQGALPEGWVHDEEDGQFLRALSTSSLSNSPDRRLEKLTRWASSTMTEAKTILAACSIS